MKKSFFSIITAFFIFTSNANSAGIPVFDGAGMAQNMVDNAMQYANMIKDYAQQVQMYKQMIVDTLNFEKHLKALGVDMEAWTDIIGEISDTINGIEGLVNNIKNIPVTLYVRNGEVLIKYVGATSANDIYTLIEEYT